MATRRFAPILRSLTTAVALAAMLTGVLSASLSSATAGSPRPKVMPALLSRAGTSNVVYLLGTTGCAAARCVRLYRSNIGATRFKRVNPPPLKGERGAIANSTLDRLEFANVNDGFALVADGDFGTTLYATSNGARTWRKVDRIVKGQMEVAISSSQIFVTTVHCVPRTLNCSQFLTRRSSLAARRWVTVPRLWNTGAGARDAYYGPSIAAYGRNVWELETAPDYLWTSRNDGRNFVRSNLTFPQLTSVSGCSLYPKTRLVLWAECPTGMQVSFWYSSDGGTVWRQVSQTQFFGTSGGAFDPVTKTIAYLDYGAASDDKFVRLSDGGREARSISELKCTEVSLTFTTVARGLALCNENDTEYSLRRTENGGVTWSSVVLPS